MFIVSFKGWFLPPSQFGLSGFGLAQGNRFFKPTDCQLCACASLASVSGKKVSPQYPSPANGSREFPVNRKCEEKINKSVARQYSDNRWGDEKPCGKVGGLHLLCLVCPRVRQFLPGSWLLLLGSFPLKSITNLAGPLKPGDQVETSEVVGGGGWSCSNINNITASSAGTSLKLSNEGKTRMFCWCSVIGNYLTAESSSRFSAPT